MKLSQPAVAIAALAMLLSACSGDASTDATTSSGISIPGVTPSSVVPTTPDVEYANDWCEVAKLSEADYTVSFGEVGSASDEWALSLGRTWRHYIPVTVTNTMSVACRIVVSFGLTVDGNSEAATEKLIVPLTPGQAFHGQLFDLDSVADFADAESTSTTSEITPSVTDAEGSFFFENYYDQTVEAGEREGTGAATLLPVSITTTAVREGMPQRLLTATVDMVWLLGLDANGDVITLSSNTVDAVALPGTTEIWFALGGGDSGGYSRQLTPLSASDSVVSWNLAIQPIYTDLDR